MTRGAGPVGRVIALLSLFASLTLSGCNTGLDDTTGTAGVDGGNDSKLSVGPVSAHTLLDRAVQIQLSGVAEGRDLTFTIISQTPSGTLGEIDNSALQSATVTYTPSKGTLGSDSFRFQCTDGVEVIDDRTATITIHAPVVFSVFPTEGPADLNVQGTAYTLTGQPPPPGLYTWTFGKQTETGPVSTHGTRSHTFTNGGVYVATLTLTLAGVTGSFNCMSTNTRTNSANVSVGPRVVGRVQDAEGRAVVSVAVVASNGGGTGVTNASGEFKLNVPLGWSGQIQPSSVAYTFSPGSINLANVNGDLGGNDFVAEGDGPGGVNHPPIVVPLADATPINTPKVITLVATDVDFDDLTFSIVSTPSHGQLGPVDNSPQSSATATYTPAAGFQGLDSFAFQVSDGQGGAGLSSLSIVVGSPPGFPIAGLVVRQITPTQTQPVAGLAMAFLGNGGSTGQNFTAVTTAAGTYQQIIPANWSGVITLQDPGGWTLHPAQRAISGLQGPLIGQDFIAGRNFYVATNGNDNNPGTLLSPFQTIQRSVNAMSAGDVAIVRQGVYNERVNVNINGFPNAPISFKAFMNETPVVDGQSTLNSSFDVGGDSIVIEGFELRNNTSHGIYLAESDASAVRRCVIHDCSAVAVYNRGGDDVVVEDNEMYNCRAGVVYLWRDTNQNFALRGFIRRNLCHHNIIDPENADGIAFQGAKDVVVENNICWKNADDGIDYSGQGNAISERGILRGNLCFENGLPVTLSGDGNGIKVSTNVGGGHFVHHNVCFLNKRAGVDQDIEPSWPHNEFYNNVCWRNGIYVESDLRGGFIIEGNNQDGQGRAYMKNNIGRGNDPSNLPGFNDRGDFFTHHFGIEVSDYNCWGYYRYADGDPGHEEGPNTITSDPLFVNPDGAINTNFTGGGGPPAKWAFIYDQIRANFSLQAGSPCVNTGTVVPGITDGFIGPAPDRGAFEFGS